MAQGLHEQGAQTTEASLAHHWMLDSVAAAELGNGVTAEGQEYIESLARSISADPEAVQARDAHRQEIATIFRGEAERQLVVIGPCSLDAETDYKELFDYIGDLQAEHPETLIAMRANGSKPRTKGGWGGLFRSTEASDQERVIEVYQEATARHIPLLTEVTNQDEFGTLAPYLSGAWLGARDMQSTALHSLFMATRLPVAVKNGTDGKAATVENALTAIGPDTDTIKQGSGVNLGMIGYTYRPNNVGLPAMVKVGEGNPNVAIIARGYELPKSMTAQEKSQAAIQHLAELCALANEAECSVLLDGGHGVPPMFEIGKQEGDRFPRVISKIHEAIEQGEIPHANRLRGYLGEISTTEGRTDKNWLISEASGPNGLDAILTRPLATA